MRVWKLGAVLLLLCSTAARAWHLDYADDPMTDEKTINLNESVTVSEDIGNVVAVSFRCSENKPGSLFMVIVAVPTPLDWAEEKSFPYRIRVDKNPVEHASFAVAQQDGSPLLVARDPKIVGRIINQLTTSNVALYIADDMTVYKFPAKDVAQQAKKVSESCGLASE